MVYVRYLNDPMHSKKLPTGIQFGDFKDEVEDSYGAGAKVLKFFSSGAKSYAFQVKLNNGGIEDVMKMKGELFSLTQKLTCKLLPSFPGITLTSTVLQSFTPEDFRNIVEKMDTKFRLKVAVSKKIKRNKRKGEITHGSMEKLWRMTAWKRIYHEGETFP